MSAKPPIQQKSVLMIERNDSLDRRIVLEAEALVEEGWQVAIIHGGPIEPESQLGIRHIHVKLLRSPFQGEKLTSLQRLGRLLFFVLFRPEAALATLEDSNVFSARTVLWLELLIVALHPFSFGGAWIQKVSGTFVEAIRSCLTSASQVLDPWSRRAMSEVSDLDAFEVIHVHDLPTLPFGVVLKKRILAIGRPCRLIYDSHELFPYQSHFSERARSRFFQLEKDLLPYCDAMIGVTPDHQNLLTLGPETQFVYLPNATSVDSNIENRTENLRQALSLPEGAKIVVFQGILTENRNIRQLVEGFASVESSIHLVLITWPTERHRITPLIASLGLESRVHLFGPIEWNKIGAWIKSADVGIIPYQPVDLNSRYCLPNKLFEFIAHEIPVIANANLESVSRLVESNGFGLCRRLVDPNDYALAINSYFDSKLSLEYKRNLAAKSAQFRWAEVSKVLRSLYRSKLS